MAIGLLDHLDEKGAHNVRKAAKGAATRDGAPLLGQTRLRLPLAHAEPYRLVEQARKGAGTLKIPF